MGYSDRKEQLIAELKKLDEYRVILETKDQYYFEPSMTEYMDKFKYSFDTTHQVFDISFEVMGTRYEHRTDLIEHLKVGTNINVIREKNNQYNPNNFTFELDDGRNVGNMPAAMCNVIAPMYDLHELKMIKCEACFVEPVSKRSRFAKKGVLFVELQFALNQ